MFSLFYRIKRLFSLYVAYHGTQDQPTTLDRVRLIPGFVVAGAQAVPFALRWIRYRDPAARARVKQILDMSGPAPVALNPAMLAKPAALRTDAATGVTIIVPVYNNLAMTMEALGRVIDHTDVPWRLIVIDDASPDPAIRPALQAFAQTQGDRVQLALQDVNLGFVGTVNNGLTKALAWDDPVVLLNTDAFVPRGWASRLLAPIWSDPSVASVTPMSNDAELGCVPAISRPKDITANLADRLDEYAQTLNGGPDWVTAPAGVGFCMAMAPQYVRDIPQFDEVFAPGYGEEVDWCQKAQRRGGRHVYLPTLFVAHMGGQSFGSEAKQRLIAKNSEVLSRRYPRFDAEVFGFSRKDPLITARLFLGLAWAVEENKGAVLPVYIAHSMGGGAEIDLRRRIARDVDTCGAALVVRLGGVFRFNVELWWPNDDPPTAAGTNDWDDVLAVLAPATARRVVYSNAVGDIDPYQVPDFILALAPDEATQIEVLVHDYFMVSPSMTLLGQDGVYHWPLDASDGAHHSRRRDGTRVTLASWQSQWSRVLQRAQRVTCFSHSSVEILQTAYPALTSLVLAPHALPVDVPKVSVPEGGITLGVLGNMSPQKGGEVVRRISQSLQTKPEAKLVVLGAIDPVYTMAKGTVCHGPYSVGDLPDLVARYGITCWVIPSIWPETFSFTTHEAIATGLPVITFDLGAQAEAVRHASAQGATGRILELTSDVQSAAQDCIDAAIEVGRNRPGWHQG